MDLVPDHNDPIHELAQFPGLPKYFSKEIKDFNIKGSKYKYFFQLIGNIILICLSLSKKECYSCPLYPVRHSIAALGLVNPALGPEALGLD